jgi:hypothetical protein
MAIESSPFGGVKLTGEDAEMFLKQVSLGSSEERRRDAERAIKHGQAMAAELAKKGHCLVSLK